VEGDRVITRPIKGTRPRGVTPEEDAANQSELLSSTKDKAELTMIVDLERNDLGRVCEFGSVKVNQALTLESYAQVHHLVAEIEGRLSPYHDDIDLLAAMFPGGSITGAPKIRAMEIIEELETHQRGVYTGAIGYIGMDGRSAWNISIRTIVRSGEVWSYNVGGGIVADSVPEEEFNETLSKAEGMKSALETPYP
jgi:para-aminobenzoate synthetase component 1